MGESKKKKKADDKTSFRRNSIVVIIVIIVIIAFSAAIRSNVLYTSFPAVKVGNFSFSAADYNYEFYSVYYQTYSNIQSSYGDIASSILDTSKPLDQQKYSDTQTWADYFKETALSNLQQTAILCSAANSSGFKLSSESKDAVNSTVEGYKQTYKNSGYSSLKAFLEANFGKGITEGIFRKNLENQYLAGEYYKQLTGKDYSKDELEKYYSQNKDKLDSFTYRQYLVSIPSDAADKTAAAADAKATAEKIAAARSESEYNNLVYQYAPESDKPNYKDGAGTLNKSQQSPSMSTDAKSWLTDSSRKPGDTAALQTSNGYLALYFISRSDNSYNVKKVRHILISVSDFTDAAKANEANSKAQDILNKWNSGDKSETSFSNLAKENSSDSNASEGGYYEVHKGQMVQEFENWCYDPARKSGDTGIVKTQYGYHIMYFVGDGDPYRYVLAKSDKNSSEYTAWFNDQKSKNTVTQTFFMRFTKKS